MPTRRYSTFDAAARRVEQLKNTPSAYGPWPGILGPDRKGWYVLTWDPAESGDE